MKFYGLHEVSAPRYSGSYTERFVEAVRRLGFEQDILFRELPVR